MMRSENPDEIVLEDVKMFHLESMNERALWIGCYTQDGKIYHLNISGDQLKYYWSDETPLDTHNTHLDYLLDFVLLPCISWHLLSLIVSNNQKHHNQL